MKKVTIVDVAKRAQVSTATVSRVLNEQDPSGKSTSDTRRKVLQAAEELGFVLNVSSRSPSRAHRQVLGCVVPDIANPFYAELVQCIVDRARRNGFQVIVSVTADLSSQRLQSDRSEQKRIEADVLRTLMRLRVAGIIGVPSPVSRDCATAWQSAINRDIRVVFVDRDLGTAVPSADSVTIDDCKGARDATWHLIRNGHKRIGMLTGPRTAPTLEARCQGFKQAHEENGLKLEDDLIQECSFERESSLQAARNLLKQRPTAILAGSSLLAESVLEAALEVRPESLKVPKDISLVMFDDVYWARVAAPRLTTVSHSPAELGVAAVDSLLQYLKEPKQREGHRIVRSPEVRIRDSVYDWTQGQDRLSLHLDAIKGPTPTQSDPLQ